MVDEMVFRRRTGRVRRELRKHRVAFAVLAVYLVIFFFPSLFMGRIVSPNDIYRHYDPWSAGEGFVAQNPVIHDPPLAYMPIAAMMKRAPEAFHWNPWLASGIPGWGSAASALLTPFILFPSFLPLPFFYTGIILLKLLFAFWMSYLWLREERLGKAGAALGALVGAACGPAFALWLWQATNATVLYPALLWAIARMAHGKRNNLFLLGLMGIGFLLSGYPAAIAFGVWLALVYSIVQFVRCRRLPFREVARGALAVIIALLVCAPVLDPFISFLGRTGYLEWRSEMSQYSLPPEHLAGLIDVDYLGSITEGWWRGDPSLGPLNNPVELTIWFGPVALMLALLGLFLRRTRGLAIFWLCFGVLIVLVMVGSIRAQWVLDIPGLRYSPTTRLRMLLPPIVAFLVGAGMSWLKSRSRGDWRRAAAIGSLVLGAGLAFQYARVAASFYPYLPLDDTRVEMTDSLRKLQISGAPFRVAPTFFWMMPNSSQIFGVEDIRSQWSSEEAYREIIRRIDPRAGQGGTVLLLNGLTMNVEDHFLKLLNVKYLIEPPSIDILRWRIEERIEREGLPEEFVEMGPGEASSTTVMVGEGLKAFELTAVPKKDASEGHLIVEAVRPETGEPIVVVSRSTSQLTAGRKIFVPVTGTLPGEMIIVRVTVIEGRFAVGHSGGKVYTRRSSSALTWAESGPEGRIYEIVDTLPRYRATWEIVETAVIDLLENDEFDFSHRTATERMDFGLAQWLAAVPLRDRRATFRILHYGPSDQVIETESAVPFLFTSSEKLTPELRVLLDGEEIEPLKINGMFVGFPVDEGIHRVTFERRIGRGWWWFSLLGVVGLVWSGAQRPVSWLVSRRRNRGARLR